MVKENYSLTFEQWCFKYKPIVNPFDPRQDLFFPIGKKAETNFLLEQNPLQVWTNCGCEGYGSIVNGSHTVNRLGYYVTEVPCELGEYIEVIVVMPNDDEDISFFDKATEK